MPLQGSLSIERMCQLAGVSRAGFYRSLQERAPVEEDMEVRNVMQQIAVEHRRRYGYRRISAELRRRGMLVNHKRVLRIMREDNLLAVQPRAFVVTTDSDHWPSFSTRFRGRWWAGRWTGRWRPVCRSQLWNRPLRNDSLRRVWCIILTVVCSTLLESRRRSCESGR